MPEILSIHSPGQPRGGPAGGPAEAPTATVRAVIDGLATYRIETWGCQMNEHDSEKMAGLLESFGLRPAATEFEADIVLLNTCSVREKASHKVFTRLGQLRLEKAARPGMMLGVCGCVAQQEQEEIFKRAPFVDLVFGPRRLASLPDLIEESRRKRHVSAFFEPGDKVVLEMESALRVSRTRAYVTVMEGCNKNCTFCIVPFTRGREACRAPDAILQEVRDCTQEGLTEIELLGQNVNAWHHGGATGGWDFSRLLGAVAGAEGVRRVRFMTSHPLHFKNSIIDTMAAHDTICRHLHLPVQTGSDRILAAMRRGYTAQDFLERIERLRRAVPGIAVSTDIIVGFPGETEADFQMTMQIVREVRFDSLFSFLYSPRPATPAAEWPDDVPVDEKKDRLHRLQALQSEIQLAKHRQLEGRTVEVLVDGPSARGDGTMCGRTSGNHLVNIPGDPSLVGSMIRVRIERAGLHSLRGTPETA